MSTDGTSTLKSSQISVTNSESKFKVSIDLYAVNVSQEDNICVDYQTSTSQGEKYWKAKYACDFPYRSGRPRHSSSFETRTEFETSVTIRCNK